MSEAQREIEAGERFEFGENWRRFLSALSEERIKEAENSLVKNLGLESLAGKTFLDIGSGSGLFSLAARRLGAAVVSFDYDPMSVRCAEELKRRYFLDDADWRIERGSALDEEYIKALGSFDIVYSWGVLHHTGDMWRAMENAALPVRQGGLLFISIYNKQPRLSAMWLRVKRLYNRLPAPGQALMTAGFAVYFVGGGFVMDVLRGQNPMDRHKGKGRRGMSVWRDVRDWIGGLPFEVASPEEVFELYRDSGFVLLKLKTVAGNHGCNEFVFRREQ
ncbi:MAG: class I SAM-dependent methyltransferase [Candidatus Nitrospinota bacterium M3_3B_026]